MKRAERLVLFLLLLTFHAYCEISGLTPCPEENQDVKCGEFEVPENWNKQGSKRIKLPLKIFKSSSDRLPIFWLSGGPGQSNMDYVPPDVLRKGRDVVLVGYRGVDGSVILNCPEVVTAMKGNGGDLLSHSSVNNFQISVQRCAARLQQEGVDLDGYTIEQVIKDVEYVRSTLGYERIDLLSGSYGTRVALLYAQQHPAHVDHSVMIGANSPGRFVWEPAVIKDQISQLSRLCASDPHCNSRTRSLENTFTEVFQNLPDRWLGFPVDPGKVKVTAFGLLYHSKTAAMAVDALLAAGEGDYSGIALMSYAYDFIMPEMLVWGDFFSKGFIDYDSSRKYYDEFWDEGLGSPMSALIMDAGMYWPTTQPGAPYKRLEQSEVNTLILSGSLDFSTPAEIATSEILPFLTVGSQVIFRGRGHVNDLLYDTMVVAGIDRFFKSGSIQFDTTPRAFNFEPQGVFTIVAKSIVAFMVVLVLLVAFLLYRTIRRIIRST